MCSDQQDGGVQSSRDSVLCVLNSSSKLASLFGQDRASFSGGNESLTYTAPKQPKKEKPGTKQEFKSFDKGFKLKLHIMQGSQDYFSFNYTLVDVEMSRVRVS